MRWIPVTERIPGIGVRVLVWQVFLQATFAHRTESGLWMSSEHGQLNPSHWVGVLPPENWP